MRAVPHGTARLVLRRQQMMLALENNISWQFVLFLFVMCLTIMVMLEIIRGHKR